MTNPYFGRGHERIFGTFPLKGDDLRRAVEYAIETGYRSFDTAQMYGNEADVGAAITQSGIPRDDFLITTKVTVANFGADAFLPSVERSLKALGGDRLDVLLLHWPAPGGDVAPSLRLLDRAHREGLAAHVGVSNYTIAMLGTAREVVEAPIVCNQVEFHPLLDQSRLMAVAADLGIPLTSYCALARGAVLDDPEISAIGAGLRRSAAQVALRWMLQKGVAANAMSTKPENIRANFDVMDFALSSVDMARIDARRARNLRIVGRDVVSYAPEFD